MNQDQQLREAAQRCVSFRIGNMGNYSEQAVKLMNIRLAFQSLAAPERVLELLDEIDSLRAALTATQQAAPEYMHPIAILTKEVKPEHWEPQQAEPSQGVGERIDIQFDSKFSNMLQAAWMDGWGACRDSEFVGSDAMQDAFNRCDTLALCIAIDQSDDPALREASKNQGEIVITKTEDGQIVAVTRQDEEGRILEVIAEAATQREQPAASNPEPQAQAGWPEVVAWALGNPRYVHQSNILPAHEFTPDAEHEDEWTALITLQSHRKAVAKKDAALKALVDAAEIGRDAAQEVATRYHAEMAGYRQNEHDAKDADVANIEAAITQGQEALK